MGISNNWIIWKTCVSPIVTGLIYVFVVLGCQDTNYTTNKFMALHMMSVLLSQNKLLVVNATKWWCVKTTWTNVAERTC